MNVYFKEGHDHSVDEMGRTRRSVVSKVKKISRHRSGAGFGADNCGEDDGEG